MGEIRRIGEIAEGRHAVALGAFDFLRGRGRQLGRGDRAGGQGKQMPAADQDFCGTLAAFAASHHQIVGNAELPYFGMVSGRPKRSQRAVRSYAKVHCGTT